MTCRTLPVKGKRQRLPASLGTQFFLADIVRPAAAALTDAAAEDQHVDQPTIVHIEVIPVVQTGTHDDHRATVGFIRVIGKLTCGADDLRPRYAGDLLCPGRGVGFHVVIVRRTVFIVQTALQAVVGQSQVVNSGHQRGGTIRQLQAFCRQFVHQDVLQLDLVEVLRAFTAKIREANIGDLILAAQHAQAQFGLNACRTITLFKVPFTFFTPAETDRTVRRHQLAVAVTGNGFPFRVVFLAQRIHQVGGTQHTASGVVTVALFQHDQHRHVGIFAHVISEVLAWLIEVEFTQHYVAHRQRHRGICTLLRCQPQVAQFGDFSVVRGHGNGFGAFVTHFGKEVGVRGTGLWNVRTPGDDVAGVVPVSRFRHIGLLTPGLRRRWRQIAIPVVEAQAGAADQGQVTRARSIGDHRHRRDWREARDTVRAVGFDGIDVRGSNQLIHFLPGGAYKAATTASLLEAFRFVGVFDNGCPGINRIAVLHFRFTPHFHQAFTHQRIFQTVGAVEIPGVAGATRAAARFMVRHIRAGARVVSLLHFPGHQTVFHENLPAA